MLNEKGFNGAIKAIKTNGEKLAMAIHQAGLFAIMQANTHGNVGFAERLIDAMGKKHDRQRVVNWLVAFGKIGVTNQEIVYRKRKDILPENLDAWIAKADNTPYWELTKEKPLVEKVDYLAIVLNAIRKHDKTLPEKQEQGYTIEESNVALLDDFRKLAAKYQKKEATTPTIKGVNEVPAVQAA